MAYGGGNFDDSYSKVLAGTYVKFYESNKKNDGLGEGACVIPLTSHYQLNGAIEITRDAFFSDSLLGKLGYHASSDEMQPVREALKNCNKVYIVTTANTSGTNATGEYASGIDFTAKSRGTRGNDLSVVTTASNVEIFLGTEGVYKANCSTLDELKACVNDYVDFSECSGTTALTSKTTTLASGTDGALTDEAYMSIVEEIDDVTTVQVYTPANESAYVTWGDTQRSAEGKMLTIVCAKSETAISTASSTNRAYIYEVVSTSANLTAWYVGKLAGCKINASVLNDEFNGECVNDIPVLSQNQLRQCVSGGYMTMHKVNNEFRVFDDKNTFLTTSSTAGESFKKGQIVRCLDRINDKIANIFNTKYLGFVQNDEDGRVALWGDIVAMFRDLQNAHAITNFNDSDITVTIGQTPDSIIAVGYIQPVQSMEKLYFTVNLQ